MTLQLDPNFLNGAKTLAIRLCYEIKAYIVYFFIAHARNGRISTSGLKYDVTFVFLDPDFLIDAKISPIRVYLRQV